MNKLIKTLFIFFIFITNASAYDFIRVFDFDHKTNSLIGNTYAYLVNNISSNDLKLNEDEVLIIKLRVINGKKEAYMQIYNIETMQKVADVLTNKKLEKILDDFEKIYF